METRGKVFLAGIATVLITVIGALLSDVFSPISESLKDTISPVPNATNPNATTFSSKFKDVSEKINPGQKDVASKAVTFIFDVNRTTIPHSIYSSLFPLVYQYEYQYECSFDGEPFEECISPKPYGNLDTEQTHFFKVRIKGLLGNTQDKPSEMNFTVVTSSILWGALKENTSAPVDLNNTVVKIDDSPPNANETDSEGRFSFRHIGQGEHILDFKTTRNTPNNCMVHYLYNHRIFVPAAQPWIDLGDLFLEDIFGPVINGTGPECPQTTQVIFESSKFDPSAVSLTNVTQGDLSIVANSKKISESGNIYETQLYINGSHDDLARVKDVKYYLHPTFEPNIIYSTDADSNFLISLNNWGIFNLKATVSFKNDTQQDLELPTNKWNIIK